MASNTAERDTHLLNVGTQCSEPLCRLVDFLPFKCSHCELSFCQEHFRVEDHKCPNYDESKHNRIAPNCPFCNVPVAIPPGQDPNVRLEHHFEKECSVMTGKLQSSSTPRCARGTCKKVLFSPIRCDKCRQQFCPSHRFPADHNCTAPTAASNQKPALSKPALPSFANTNQNLKKFNAKASETVDSMKKGLEKGVASASAAASAATASSSASTSKPSLPFNKTDRPISISVSTVNDTSATTTETTATPSPRNVSISKPVSVISSFVPRPIFATA